MDFRTTHDASIARGRRCRQQRSEDAVGPDQSLYTTEAECAMLLDVFRELQGAQLVG